MPEPADRPPLRDQIADRLGQTIAQWWQTPPRLDLAADAVMPVVEAETAALRERAERAERERDEALEALAYGAETLRRAEQALDQIAHERRGKLAAEAAVRRAREVSRNRIAVPADVLLDTLTIEQPKENP